MQPGSMESEGAIYATAYDMSGACAASMHVSLGASACDQALSEHGCTVHQCVGADANTRSLHQVLLSNTRSKHSGCHQLIHIITSG